MDCNPRKRKGIRNCFVCNHKDTVNMVETNAIAMKSLDRLLRDVLSDTPEEDRGKLITVCLNSAPQRMNFVECVTLVSAFSKMGMVDINNLENDRIKFRESGIDSFHVDTIKFQCQIDTDGRITGLIIFHSGEYDLPAIIACLERLTEIYVYKCRSLPVELTNLPHLERLHLGSCNPDIFENFPIQMKLNNLKKLCIYKSVYPSAPSQFLTWMTSQLPSLEDLELYFLDSDKVSYIVDYLRTKEVCFRNSLKNFIMSYCCFDNDSFEILLLEIVPKLQNLRSLNLQANNIQSFLPILNSVKNDASFLPSTSLRVLDVSFNPVFKKIKEDPDEKAAVLSFLGTFNTISNLGGRYKSDYDYDSDIEYGLRINHAGRRIVVKAAIDGSGSNDAGKAVVPISLWPTILERAYAKSLDIYNPFINTEAMKKNATGIYYLLREVGPTILLASQRRPDVCIISKDIVNNDKDDDDSDGSGEAKTNNKSLKRKYIIKSNDRFVLETRNKKDPSSSLSSPSPSTSTKRSCHG